MRDKKQVYIFEVELIGFNGKVEYEQDLLNSEDGLWFKCV